jgi:hypothetical protein
MENLLSQDDLNALFGETPENTKTVAQKELKGMENLLSQDDLNALFGETSENTTVVAEKELKGMENLLSQDDLNALFGGLPEKTITISEQMTFADMPADDVSSGGESMSQEEIDEMLRQFDRNI